MTIPVLLVATATQWFGTARIPRALAKAGFDVALLTPRNSLAEKSRFVSKIGFLPNNATTMQWVHAFAAMVEAVSPRLVIPGDDMAFRLLQLLTLNPPPELQPAVQLKLAMLIRESLGDPEYYRASVDKTLLPPAAQALGVRVPPFAIVSRVDEAEATAAQHGFPLVLKRAHGFAGQGVAICSNPAELERAFGSFIQADAAELDRTLGVRLLAQAYIPGSVTYYGMSSWKGNVLAGYATDKVVANPHPTGPATVLRYHRDPALRDFAARLTRGFGMSGFYSLESIIHAETGEPYLLEICRRVAPGTFRGAVVGVDMCAALRAAIDGLPSPSRTDLGEGETGIRANFPQEWRRDPDSHYLREYPVDVPWDEPELIEAMLSLSRER